MSVLRVPSLARCQFWGSPHLHDVSFEGPLTCWMSVLRVPSLAGCQFLEGPLTCLDVMWSLFWSKLDLKMKIWPTSGRFGENCLLKLVLVCPILTQWWNKKNWVYFPFNTIATAIIIFTILKIWIRGANGDEDVTSPEGSPGPPSICAHHQQVSGWKLKILLYTCNRL